MRASSIVLVFILAAPLAACIRETAEQDAGPGDDASYDPAVGYGFAGALALDDTRVMGLDPTSLRHGTTQCRPPILARVLRVIDGDTIHVMGISEPLPDTSVRFTGVNAPEIPHMAGDPTDCYGPEATVFTSQLSGHVVWLTFDVGCTDPFGRLLAYVHIGAGAGDMWQRQLVRRGFAHAVEYPPNSSFAPALAGDQTIAQSERVGLWAACP